jgi:hypothetical protein
MLLFLFCFAATVDAYAMGFSPMLGATPFPKDRYYSNGLWALRGDAMIVHLDMPWTLLLVNKTRPLALVNILLSPAVAQMNAFGVKKLFVTLDVTSKALVFVSLLLFFEKKCVPFLSYFSVLFFCFSFSFFRPS